MTTITIDLPDTVIVPVGRNAVHGSLTVDWSRFPMNALQYLTSYGLTQALNDARAEPKDKDGNLLTSEDKVAKCQDKLEALYAGNIRMRGETVAADAYEAEAIREAKRFIYTWLGANGLTKDIPKKTENRMMYVINRHFASQGKPEVTEAEYLATFFTTAKGKAIMERAIKTVDERRELAADMDDLI